MASELHCACPSIPGRHCVLADSQEKEERHDDKIGHCLLLACRSVVEACRCSGGDARDRHAGGASGVGKSSQYKGLSHVTHGFLDRLGSNLPLFPEESSANPGAEGQEDFLLADSHEKEERHGDKIERFWGRGNLELKWVRNSGSVMGATRDTDGRLGPGLSLIRAVMREASSVLIATERLRRMRLRFFVIHFGPGQLNGAAAAVHEETEEFACRKMAIATSSTWRRNRASAGRVP